MCGSNHDEESDRRSFALCPTCLAKLQEAIGPEKFRLADREEALAVLLEMTGLQEMAAWHKNHLEELRKCGSSAGPPAASEDNVADVSREDTSVFAAGKE